MTFVNNLETVFVLKGIRMTHLNIHRTALNQRRYPLDRWLHKNIVNKE